jgi:hypothetical protein
VGGEQFVGESRVGALSGSEGLKEQKQTIFGNISKGSMKY